MPKFPKRLCQLYVTKKSHTCEEGGTHLRICLAFIDELQKQLFIKKNCWSRPMKIVVFTMLYFFKIIKKNTWKYHYLTLVYPKSSYDLHFLRYRVWEIRIGNYGLFFALLPPPLPSPQKIKKSELKKNIAGNIIILQMSTKSHNNYEAWFLRYRVRDIIFFWFWTIFWAINTVPEICHAEDRTFCYFGLFFALLPPPLPLTNWKIKTLKKEKNTFKKILHKCTKMTIIWCMVSEIRSAPDRICLSFWAMFCPFHPLITQKIN